MSRLVRWPSPRARPGLASGSQIISAPVASGDATVVVGTGSATAAGTAVATLASSTIVVGTGAADAVGTAVATKASSTVVVGTGAATAAGTAVAITELDNPAAGTGSATADGTAVATKASSTVAVGTGSADAAGTAVAAKASSTVVVGTGSATAQGTAVNISDLDFPAVGTGSATAAGTAVATKASGTAVVGTGSADAAGTAVATKASSTVVVGMGSADAAGTAVATKASSTVVVGTGVADAAGATATPTVSGAGDATVVVGTGAATAAGTSASGAALYSFIRDTFTETSSIPLSLHTPEIGAWTKSSASDSGVLTVDQVGDRVYLSATGGGATLYYGPAPPSADYSVAADFVMLSTAATNIGIAARMSTSANTLYTLRYTSVGTAWGLFAIVAGTATTIGGPSTTNVPTVGTPRRAVLTVNGSNIVATVDGVEIFNVTDSSITAAGRPGIRGGGVATASNAGVHIDNFNADAAFLSSVVGTGSATASGTAVTPVVVETPTPPVEPPDDGVDFGGGGPIRGFQVQRDARVRVGTGGAYAKGTAAIPSVRERFRIPVRPRIDRRVTVGAGVAVGRGAPGASRLVASPMLVGRAWAKGTAVKTWELEPRRPHEENEEMLALALFLSDD